MKKHEDALYRTPRGLGDVSRQLFRALADGELHTHEDLARATKSDRTLINQRILRLRDRIAGLYLVTYERGFFRLVREGQAPAHDWDVEEEVAEIAKAITSPTPQRSSPNPRRSCTPSMKQILEMMDSAPTKIPGVRLRAARLMTDLGWLKFHGSDSYTITPAGREVRAGFVQGESV